MCKRTRWPTAATPRLRAANAAMAVVNLARTAPPAVKAGVATVVKAVVHAKTMQNVTLSHAKTPA